MMIDVMLHLFYIEAAFKGTRSLPNVFLYSLCIDRKEHEELRRIKVWTKKFARVALFYEALRNVIIFFEPDSTVANFSYWLSRGALSENRLSMT